MIQSLKARMFIILFIVVFSALYVAPNFVEKGMDWSFSQKKINYGLDIQGGLHLVLRVDVDGVVKENSVRLASTLSEVFKEKKISGVKVSNKDSIDNPITIETSGNNEQVLKLLEDNYGTELQVLERVGNKINLKYYDNYINDYNYIIAA